MTKKKKTVRAGVRKLTRGDSPTAPRAKKSRERLVALVSDAFPSSWLDPLLTGPEAVVGKPPYSCRDIEALMEAVEDRVVWLLKAAK
jgi:hypothetical protein